MHCTPRRAATQARNFSAHDSKARERCHVACRCNNSAMSALTETLQESLPDLRQSLLCGQLGDPFVRHGIRLAKRNYARQILGPTDAQSNDGKVVR